MVESSKIIWRPPRSRACPFSKKTVIRKPTEYTEEQKAEISKKISDAHKGKPKSIEHKQKLSDYFTGRSNGKRTEETKAKMRKPKTEETKAKMRKPKSAEHRKAISEARIKKYKELKSSN